MAQEYKILSVKKGQEWHNSYGTFQGFGLSLSGVGEPVRLNKAVPVQTEPQIGEVLYGNLIEARSADGTKTFYEFQPVKPPDALPTTAGDEERARWAITQAVSIYLQGSPDSDAYDNIKREAVHLFKMVDGVILEGKQ